MKQRAIALARARGIQSVSELKSFYLNLNHQFIGAYPFPDQPHLRRTTDWDVVTGLADFENEMLLRYYEKILVDKKEAQAFLKEAK